jgi:hypothetical protein
MTPAEEAEFIQLWNPGASYKAIAQAQRCPLGTVASRSAALVAQGKITSRPRGGRRAKAQPDDLPAPASPPVPARVDIEQWTVRLSKALIERIKAEAVAAQKPPSHILEELAWKALNDQSPSIP